MWTSLKTRVIASAAVAVALVTPALASPPSMGAVEFPVDTASVVTAIATAGGTILVLYFGVRIGFSLVKKLFGRTQSSI